MIDDADTLRKLAAVASDPKANPNEAGNAARGVFALLKSKGLKLEDVFGSGVSEEEAQRREGAAYQRGLQDGEQKALGDVQRELERYAGAEPLMGPRVPQSPFMPQNPFMAPAAGTPCRRCLIWPCQCGRWPPG